MISAASATRRIRETSAARLSSIGQFYEIVTCRATFSLPYDLDPNASPIQ
jgi:hypothetical protein